MHPARSVRSSKQNEYNNMEGKYDPVCELISQAEDPIVSDEELSSQAEFSPGKNQHIELIRKLRLQLRDLERYAYERGELDSLDEMHDKKDCQCQLQRYSTEQQTNSEHTRGSSPVQNATPTNTRLENQTSTIPNEPAWTSHIDRIILATDSIVNLYTLEPEYQRSQNRIRDNRIVLSILRRQFVPAINDLISYGLFDPDSLPQSTSFTSYLFDPYYILSSLTCFPSSQKLRERGSIENKIHVWHVIEDYFHSRSGPNFKSSSIKTLSQSFNLAPSLSGPLKITSKQALLLAIDDIIETMSKSKPNGPESHFQAFIYAALNRAKLATWLRLIFMSKSVAKKYYHEFSFVCQADKMERFFDILEPLVKIEFKLQTDVESLEQLVSAF